MRSPSQVTAHASMYNALKKLSLWGRGKMSPLFWDSDPIAQNLDYAFHCFPGHKNWANGARQFVNEVLTSSNHRGAFSILSPETFPPCGRIQSKMYHALVSEHFSCKLEDTIMKRVCELFAPYEVDPDSLDTNAAFEILKQLRKHDAVRVIKTWVNAWATSNRYHEAVQFPCLFGCKDCADKLSHYVMCPNLYFLICQSVQASSWPLERIGLHNPSQKSLLTLACVFSAYHAVKRNSNITTIVVDSNPWNNDQLLVCLGLFASSFWVEANEVGLSPTRFRPSIHDVLALQVGPAGD